MASSAAACSSPRQGSITHAFSLLHLPLPLPTALRLPLASPHRLGQTSIAGLPGLVVWLFLPGSAFELPLKLFSMQTLAVGRRMGGEESCYSLFLRGYTSSSVRV